MPKRLCDWKKERIKDKFEEYKDLVRDPKFVCKKCGRSSNDKKNLCKPEKLA